MSISARNTRRIFLRLESSAALDEAEIVDQFLTHFGYNKKDSSQHFIHLQPREYRHFFIIIDIDYAQDPDANVQELPHEVYLVSFKGGSTDL